MMCLYEKRLVLERSVGDSSGNPQGAATYACRGGACLYHNVIFVRENGRILKACLLQAYEDWGLWLQLLYEQASAP